MLVPKVLQTRSLMRCLVNFKTYLIFTNLSVQTFVILFIVIEGSTSVNRPLSYLLRSLSSALLKAGREGTLNYKLHMNLNLYNHVMLFVISKHLGAFIEF